MGLLDLIAAYAIAQGSHTGGHFAEANKQNVPMQLDVKKLAELWEQDNTSKKNATDINGKGFELQDRISNGIQGKTREDVSKINALIKAIYIAGLPQRIGDFKEYKGDIKEMQKLSGNKYVPHMIGATALSDLLQKGDSRASLGFMVENGQPGIKFNYRW